MNHPESDTATIENSSNSDYLDDKPYHPDAGTQPNNLSKDLSKTISHEGVQSLVEKLEQDNHGLGPLEEPYDGQKVSTRTDPTAGFNDADPWKYPIDAETGLRLVEFIDGDTGNPKNRGVAMKWAYTLILGMVCFTVALGSAIVTGDLEHPAKYFKVSQEMIILSSVTVFVLGFGFGPLVFAPASEELGRKPIYVVTLGIAVIFIIPCALAKNIATLLVCRLIDGLAFSAPMCLIGGSLADIWDAKERGLAMAVFSAAPFLGPVCGPIFGGLLGDFAPTWRWIYWAFLIIAGFFYVLFITVVPETHHNTILKKRSKFLRKTTGDERYKALCELKERSTIEVFKTSMTRPFLLLSEVIVFLVTLYMSVCYGLLYMFFFAFPVVYMEGKGWSASKMGIMFIPIGVGVICASAITPFINNDYNRRAQPYRDRGELPPPELRLLPMMFGCWFLPVGLFAFAWSSYEHISWAGPCFSGFAVGFGFLLLYNPANNYIVDSYQHYAASALAAKTFVRSVYGACVPLFTIQMYHKLGNEWASSLMAFIALACCLIPFLFYRYGLRIRKFSKYAYAG